ncbi:MAG: alpha-L-arabinofuranosidase C-terminal domain-containing protein [Verrucomicrobiota bacterium]
MSAPNKDFFSSLRLKTTDSFKAIFVRASHFVFLGLIVLAGSIRAQTTATVTIQSDLPGVQISPNLFGIFFEEINMAGDGGIYDELVRNRLFEDASTPVQWTLATNGVATGSFAIDTLLALNPTNTQELALTKSSGNGSIGAVNGGYYGMPVSSGATYNLVTYARCAAGFTGSITVALQSADGSEAYALGSISGLTTNWQRFAISLAPTLTDPSAQLELSIAQAGTVYLGFVSLSPAQTFNSRTNGLRPDLATMLVNLRPSFMRFPGGSWVDGTSLTDAYHWEPTAGPLIDRKERMNVWGYTVSNGLGFYEYLQMCEDIGAQPLFCINCGMDVNQDAVATNDLGSWVQEVLDAIQYANGDTNTTWGAQRAAAGHPAPFNLQYIEVGNENNGAAYNANYAYFYNAIKSNYPAMHVIADSQGTIPTSAPVEMVDQHYYSDPGFFESSATLYDHYSRSGPKVFVGEYAVTSGSGNGNLAGALGEAAFMTGMERNSDVVQMASYAPLFCNLNNKNWNPDLIYFNGTRVYGTPSYYVQQMFSLNRGNLVLPTTVSSPSNPIYVSSSLISANGQIVVKVVNPNPATISTTFNVLGVDLVARTANLVQLTSDNATNENSLSNPTLVFPTTNVINNASTNFAVTLPANSLSIFTLQVSGFETLSNLKFGFNSPLSAGQVVPSTVSVQESGQTNLISLAGNYAVAYSSENTNVAEVDNNGNVAGVGIGTTAIFATYGGLIATQSVQVLPTPPTTMIHRYSFNDGTANDSVGTNNGIFYNASGNASIANGQLNLPGDDGDYVDLGPGIITSTNITSGAVTLEAWATFNSINGAWARLFDFGNISGTSGANYIFLAANNAGNGGDARLAVSDIVGNGDETGFDVNDLLGQTNLHVVVVFNPAPDRQFLGLYTNGVLVASTPTAGKTIASINDAFSFLGRSLWSGDAWLNGSINEFRVYNGELNRFQIAASGQAGPDTVNLDPGSLVGFSMSAGVMPIPRNSSRQISAQLDFSMATNVNVLGDPNLTLSSDNDAIFTVNSSGLVHATGIGAANLIGVYNYINSGSTNSLTNSVVVRVIDSVPATLLHRYSFKNGTANDLIGTANGVLHGNAIISEGQLMLPNATPAAPASDYLQLPAGILTNALDGIGPYDNDPAVTIEAWATFAPNQYTWANLFDFGSQDASGDAAYDIHACVHASDGDTVVGISDSDNANVDYQYVDCGGGSGLDGATNVHVVCVFDPPGGYVSIYANGVLLGFDSNVTITMAGVVGVRNIIGADDWPDPGMRGSVQEFRIYNGVLQADEMAATQILGPNQLLSDASPVLSVSASGGSLMLSWPLVSAGFTLMASSSLAPASWTPLSTAPQIINSNLWQVTVPVSTSVQYYRLQN